MDWGEILLTGLKIGLALYAGNIVLALFSSTVFTCYFNAKKKYMKELNQIDDKLDGR